MKKENDEISSLFNDFNPDLSSGRLFMSRLEHNLDTVEIVKKRNAAFHKASRKAVAIAAFAGFVTGIMFTILLPVLRDMALSIMSVIKVSVPEFSIPEDIADNLSIIASCMAVGLPSILISVNAYRISLPLISGKRNP